MLGFDGAYQVAHQGQAGILTSAARPGAVVRRGGVLYRVEQPTGTAAVRHHSGVPGLAAGMPDGPDVNQVERNLAALRLDPGQVDQRFTGATAAAIRRWQARWGLPAWQRTGTLPLGTVVFAPAALRIGQVPAVVGTSVAPDAPVLAATSTRRVVTAQVPADRQSLVHPGDKVTVTVSGASAPVPGTVERVGRGRRHARDQPGCGRWSRRWLPAAAVTVTVRADLPAGGPDLDQAPAQLAITTAAHRDVLLVPVVALLPAPGDGYQVRLASGEPCGSPRPVRQHRRHRRGDWGADRGPAVQVPAP